MNELAHEYPAQRVAKVLEVSRAGHYRKPGTGSRSRENIEIREHIHRVFMQHDARYGSPRIWMQLKSEGIVCSENRVARLMRVNGWRAVDARRTKPRTTDSRHGGPIAPNIVKNTEVYRPNQVWVMDITYVQCGQKWVYLAVVLDLYLHKIVGWQLADHLGSSLVVEALRMAAEKQGYPLNVIVHSDRGCQYASEAFIQVTNALGYTRSMSAKGNCYDNATMESFFGVIKREELNRWHMPDQASVRYRVFSYIETYYNKVRIHTALGMAPEAFEKIEKNKDEFFEAWIAPQVGQEKAGESPPRPRPVVAISTYPLASCSPAELASVSMDTHSKSQTIIEHNNEKEYINQP
jgi:putative transposase